METSLLFVKTYCINNKLVNVSGLLQLFFQQSEFFIVLKKGKKLIFIEQKTFIFEIKVFHFIHLGNLKSCVKIRKRLILLMLRKRGTMLFSEKY